VKKLVNEFKNRSRSYMTRGSREKKFVEGEVKSEYREVQKK